MNIALSTIVYIEGGKDAVRVFKTRVFMRFARKESLSDKKLAEAVLEIERGLHNGDLGGSLVKKRVARAGAGKSGGYRTIIVYQRGHLAVFVFGFAKNDRDNLSTVELRDLQKLAKLYLGLSQVDIEKALKGGELYEIETHKEEISQ